MKVITYSLREGQSHSDRYYQVISNVTDQVLVEARGWIQGVLAAFHDDLHGVQREQARSKDEYVLDLLTLGVLWQVYGGRSLHPAQGPRRLLSLLADMRERYSWVKPAADWVRGVLSTLVLQSNNRSEVPSLTLDRLDRLLSWLDATGTFREEVKRISLWRDFLRDQAADAAESYLESMVEFASWFQEYTQQALGRYTPNVDQFLAEVHPAYRWREDAIFCGRQRVEYHLCMVGSEILNRAFRQDFVQTERKLVLLPPCMRPQPDTHCQAVQTPFGERCAGCTPTCHIHQVSQMGAKHGFEVLILPDELSIFSGKETPQAKDNAYGVVGVSCVLTNPSGGWETKALKVPAQGVLLDYCGCSYHWHRSGIATAINLRQLKKVLGIDAGRGKAEYAKSAYQVAL